MFLFRHKFSTSALYRQREEEPLSGFLSKRWSFWLALFSCIAFLIGNMVGQHGWGAFWKSVWGREDASIVFTGTAIPLAKIPDPERWGGSPYQHTFSDIPEPLLISLPVYQPREHCGLRGVHDRRVFSVRYLGDYENGGDRCGSHPAVDILAPEGTPVYA